MNKELYEKKADDKDYLVIYKYELSYEKKDFVHIVPHYHGAVELKFVVSGKYLAHIGKKQKVLVDKEVVFVDSFIPHSYTVLGETLCYTIIFSREFLNKIGLNNKTFPTFVSNKNLFDNILPLVEYAYREWDNKDEYFKVGFLYCVLGLLMQKITLEDKTDDDSTDFCVALIEYINKNYNKDITLQSLSRQFLYTESHFSRIFNKFMGMNLREYINRKRVAEAVRIKEENPLLSLSRIAEMVGYKSIKTFYRVYSQYSQN